jgi:hypothetical protein
MVPNVKKLTTMSGSKMAPIAIFRKERLKMTGRLLIVPLGERGAEA